MSIFHWFTAGATEEQTVDSVLGYAVGLWQAKNYQGNGPLVDESGNRRHMYLGSTRQGVITKDGLDLPGVAGNYATTGDDPVYDITGDIEIRLKVTLPDYTPASVMYLFSKYDFGDERSWVLSLASSNLQFAWSEDGLTNDNFARPIPGGMTDGETYWIRVTFDVSEYEGKMFWSTDGVEWTQMGTTATGAATSIHPGTGTIVVGTSENDVNNLNGVVHNAMIYDGIGGTIVYSASFAEQPPGTTSFTHDGTGDHTVTITQAAGDTNDPMFVEYQGEQSYFFPTGASNGEKTIFSDSVPLSVTGDIDIRVDIKLETYSGSDKAFLGKWGGGTERGYAVGFMTNGDLRLWITPDGTYTNRITYSVAGGLTGGDRYQLRFTLDVDNGANSVGKIYKRTDGDITSNSGWTQIGGDQTAAITSIFNGTDELLLGTWGANSSAIIDGHMFRVLIYDGIAGTLVLDAPYNDRGVVQEPYDTFTEQSSNEATGTIGRSSSGRHSTIVTRNLFLLGTDDYLEIDHDTVFDLTTTNAATMVFFGRAYDYDRQWPIYVSKADGFSSNPHWHFFNDVGNDGQWVSHFHDGSNNSNSIVEQPVHIVLADGKSFVGGFTYDRVTSDDEGRTFINSRFGYGINNLDGDGTLANSLPVRVGSSSHAVNNPLDGEFYALAWFTSELTITDIVQLEKELRIGVNRSTCGITGG